MKKVTHEVAYKMDGGFYHKQNAYGIRDLHSLVDSLLKDGYTEITITVIKS